MKYVLVAEITLLSLNKWFLPMVSMFYVSLLCFWETSPATEFRLFAQNPLPWSSPTTGQQELTRETILNTEMCWNGGNDECLLHLKKSIQNRDPT